MNWSSRVSPCLHYLLQILAIKQSPFFGTYITEQCFHTVLLSKFLHKAMEEVITVYQSPPALNPPHSTLVQQSTALRKKISRNSSVHEPLSICDLHDVSYRDPNKPLFLSILSSHMQTASAPMADLLLVLPASRAVFIKQNPELGHKTS